MEKIQFIHNCLAFELNKQKFVYGITNCMLMSNFMVKFRPNFVILPSRAYVNGVFMLAAVESILKRLENKGQKLGKEGEAMIDKLIKSAKFLVTNQKSLSEYFIENQVGTLIQNGLLSSLKEHQIEQKSLIKLHESHISSQLSPQPDQNANPEVLDWINCPPYQLRIQVPQIGMTTYICQGTNIIVIDPTQQFVNYLKYNKLIKGMLENEKQKSKYEVPNLLTLLKTVVVTKMMSVFAVINLMLVPNVNKVTVIVISEELETALIQKSKRYFNLPEEITRSRLLIRNIGVPIGQKINKYPIVPKNYNPFNMQTSSALSIQFHSLSQQNQPYLQLTFGSSIDIKSNKKIIFYCPSSLFSTETQPETELTHFPQLLEDNYVQFVVLYKVKQELMKELKELPQPLRKKIILNRNEHKYNHKYFLTLEKNKIQYCLVTDTQFLQLMTVNKKKKNEINSIDDILQNFKNKQIVAVNMENNINSNIIAMNGIQIGARVYQMGHNAQIQTIGQVVQVLQGIVLIQFQQSKKLTIICGNKELFSKSYRIKALKYALVKIIIQNDHKIATSVLRKNDSLQPSSASKILSPLPITTNTVLSSLFGIEHLSTIEDNSLLKSLILSQKRQLNKICHPITYEVGFKTNNHNESLYFISKGGMKWEDHDEVAGNGCFIGDLTSYYGLKQGSILQFDNYIEVVKDTWALEINVQQFHQFILMRYPHLLYDIFCRGKIFH